MSPWRQIGLLCTGILVISILSCIAIVATRSAGLTSVTLTALDPAKEPVDHIVPLVKRHEALPEYQLTVLMRNSDRIELGTKPDASAANGLKWQLAEPVCVAEIATLRLTERDKLISDPLAEVHVTGPRVTENGYRFDFQTERSVGVGLHAFFRTPIGMAISGAVFLAVFLIVFSRMM